MVDKCFKIKKEDLSIFNKIRIRLPTKLNGIGFRRLVDVRWSEFVGRMMEGVIPLLDKTSEGNNIKDMLESSNIEHWIGRNPLDSSDGPWHRLEQQESAMCLGMKIAYTYVCGQFDQAGKARQRLVSRKYIVCKNDAHRRHQTRITSTSTDERNRKRKKDDIGCKIRAKRFDRLQKHYGTFGLV